MMWYILAGAGLAVRRELYREVPTPIRLREYGEEITMIHRFKVSRTGMVAGMLLLLAGLLVTPPAVEAEGHGVFEMRTYTTHPGKLGDLHNRFSGHTNALFVKHGMRLIGYWTPTEAPESENTLVYILAYPSREAREKSWTAFRNDPVWKAAYADSIKDGKLVKKVDSVFMSATAYSPIQ